MHRVLLCLIIRYALYGAGAFGVVLHAQPGGLQYFFITPVAA